MQKTLQSLLKINYRVILFVIIFFILIDVMITTTFNKDISGDGTFRLHAEEENVLAAYINKIQNDTARKVLFIGDSVMFGSAAQSDEQTIPAHFANEMAKKYPNDEIHYYNIGLKGLGTADSYYMLKLFEKTNTSFDLIVYDVNIGWFTDKKIINRELVLNLYPTDEIDWKELNVSTPEDKGLDGWLQNNIMRHWKLYHYRYLVNYWLLGNSAYSAVSDYADSIYFPDKENPEDFIYEPWYKKDWDKELSGDWKIGKIQNNNPQWNYFEKFLQLIDKTSDESAIFFIARNKELLDKYNKLDQAEMEKTKATITKTAGKHNIYVFDYEYTVDSKLFSDTVHLLPEGNRIIANSLIQDITKRDILIK